MVIKHTSRKEKIHFTYTKAWELESFRVVKCDVVEYCVSELFVQGVENTTLIMIPTCQYAEKRTHKIESFVRVKLKKFALTVLK